MIEIFLLEQLDAFARKGTLAAASEELHLTQPTLTRSMQKLEQEIGVPLFERGNKKIRLNENGLLAAEYAAKILAMEKEMKHRIRIMEQNRNTFHFGAVSPGPIKELVPQLMDHLHGKAITAEIKTEAELIEGLGEGRFQIIALNRPVEHSGLFGRKVFSERIYYCFLPDGRPPSQAGVYFSEINGKDILMSSDVGFWKEIIDENMPDSTVILQEGNELLDLVAEHSDLPAFSSDIAIKHNMARPARAAVPILDDAAKADFYCLCRADNEEAIKIIGLFSDACAEWRG